MPSSPSAWDAKHCLAANEAAEAPAGILTELWPLLPAGAALDLACGRGRNALFLAEHRRHVTAVDCSRAALDILEARARSLKVPVRRVSRVDEAKPLRRAGIDLLQADLEAVTLSANRYSVIVCVRYLQRSLFGQICRALRPGGMLLFETYTKAQLDFSGGPRDPAHLLNSGELRRAFPELEVVFYRELCAELGIASLAARKPQGHNDHHTD
ncbi:MAG TPA: class I SAM-dependent methyltransferase [Candidatus Acidoferrum sp.]|nr:class I SAM-dependent methyltransferase [Candidatus Acidoferrum sp.]